MKIIDNAALEKELAAHSLASKSVSEMSVRDREELADILSKYTDSGKAPYFDKETLVIPFGAPLDCRWWQVKMSGKQKMDLLLRLGVPEDQLTRFMSQRAIDVALGKCDISGNPPKPAA